MWVPDLAEEGIASSSLRSGAISRVGGSAEWSRINSRLRESANWCWPWGVVKLSD